MYIYIDAYIDTYMYTCLHTYMHKTHTLISGNCLSLCLHHTDVSFWKLAIYIYMYTLYIYVYVYISPEDNYTHTHVCTCLYTYMKMNDTTHTCVRTCLYTYMNMNDAWQGKLYARFHTGTCTYMHADMQICRYMNPHTYGHMRIHQCREY